MPAPKPRNRRNSAHASARIAANSSKRDPSQPTLASATSRGAGSGGLRQIVSTTPASRTWARSQRHDHGRALCCGHDLVIPVRPLKAAPSAQHLGPPAIGVGAIVAGARWVARSGHRGGPSTQAEVAQREGQAVSRTAPTVMHTSFWVGWTIRANCTANIGLITAATTAVDQGWPSPTRPCGSCQVK